MAKYFSLTELVRSSVADEKGIVNSPDAATLARLEALMDNLLDPVREEWGVPIRVTSGYRCPVLNRMVGGAASSQHLLGEAADITTGSRDGNRRLFEMITGGGFGFDQLIDEHNFSWLHVSYRAGSNRRQVLHLK